MKIPRIAAFALSFAYVFGAHAQPSTRMLTIVVPQPPGNPTDGVARKLQALLASELKQTVVVENAPGAGGSIGTAKVLAAKADGNTILIASQTEPILTPFSLAHVKYKPEDLRMVALVARTSYILVARPDLPGGSLTQLAEEAKKPGAKPLSFGHIGPGSMIHLLGEQWSRQAGVSVLHVPYKGVPPLSQDVMAGQIDISFLPLGGTLPSLIDTGKVQALGTTAAVVNPRFGKVPAIQSQSPAMKDFVYGTWVALLAPRSTPADAIARLNQALAAAMKDSELQSYVASTGMESALPMTVPELDKFYQQETKTYQALSRSVGVDVK
ncbi:MAG: tripartite tricarboxylate transporter substrate binding protein [Variovorax sp.]